MKSPIPQVTAILLLLHVAVGCCFHHAHSCVVQRWSAPVVQTADCCGYAAHPPAPRRPTPHPFSGHDDRQRQHECDGKVCVFIVPDAAPELAEARHGQVVWLDANEARAADAPRRIADAPPPYATSGAGLRAHRLFQIMLI